MEMSQVLQQSQRVVQPLQYSNRQREIYEQVAEMSKTLGIPVPTVLIAGIDGTRKELLKSRGLHKYDYLGYAFQKTHELYINPTGIRKSQKDIKEHPNYYNYRYNRYYKINKKKFSLRHVIAHELIHLAFHDLEHGDRFEHYYVDSLLSGHMVFYKHSKVEMIITKVSKEPAPSVNETINAELAKLTKRRKQWENKLKRATTAIKKIDKKIKRLEKRAEREGEEGEGND